MSKELERVFAKNDDEKLLTFMESKLGKQTSQSRELPLSKEDLSICKQYIHRKVMNALHSESEIPSALISALQLLGAECMAQARTRILNYTISQSLAEVSQRTAAAFAGLGSLKEIYKYLEKCVEQLNDRYYNLPSDWNLELKFLCKAFVIVKQQICDQFFMAEPDVESYVRGLTATIAFEMKLRPFFLEKNCCYRNAVDSRTGTEDADKMAVTSCIHNRMLSSIFIPHIELYYSYALKSFVQPNFEQSDCEMHIVRTFLLFFHEIELLLATVSYFDDAFVFKALGAQIDAHLCRFISHLRIDETVNGAKVVLSTIVYIRETVHDLVENMTEYSDTGYPMDVLDRLAALEKLQTQKLEHHLSQNFPAIKNDAANFPALKNWFEAFIAEIEDACEDVRLIFMEIAAAILFVKISQVQMTMSTAENLLQDACDIEHQLNMHALKLPYMKTVKDYLKIFVCPTGDKEQFVANFKLIGGHMFSFDQILMVLANHADVEDLFVHYKQTTKDTADQGDATVL